ncbi:MAG: hypothetical protein AAB328_07825, partial [candidate division NC10 bacterium]
YYALWRLLEPEMLATPEAFGEYPAGQRCMHFIRRTKEEMVFLDGRPLYPKRISDTLGYKLAQGEVSEQALYDETTDYLRFVYNKAKLLNREAARLAMATRARELHAFSHPSRDDVLLADCGRGLTVALIGLDPAFRLPFEGYYAFFALRNGVPVGYGGAWCLFETMEFGFNIFESFRQGESRLVLGQVLSVFHHVFGIRAVVVDPYQIGHGNAEALRSGAFYFYSRLGFRPHDPEVLALAAQEQEKIARDRAYRSPLPVLRRLVRGEMCLRLPGASRRPEGRIRASQLATLATQHIARRFAGDGAAAVREATSRVSQALGAPGWRRWPPAARAAFERWALLLSLVPDLSRWPAPERRSLLRMIRAKGDTSEAAYVRLMDGHSRLRQALERLVHDAASAASAARP